MDDDSKNTKKKAGGGSSAASPGPQQPPQQRTIQVKIGGQAAKSMTPDQAAEYLKSIAGKAGMTATSRSGGGAELKMTFSSSGTSAKVSATTTTPTTSSSSSSTTGSTGGTNIGGEVGGGVAANSNNFMNNNNGPNVGSKGRRKDGMPCSEKEMKALMSMFVEIMGLQMNTEKLNQCKPTKSSSSSSKSSSSSSKSGGNKTNSSSKAGTGSGSNNSREGKQLFTFPQDLPPPPGGWPEDLLWPDHDNYGGGGGGTGGAKNENGEYDDGECETNSLPDLEDVVIDDEEEVAKTTATKPPPSSTAAAAGKGNNKKGKNGSTAAAGAPISSSCNYLPMVQPEPVTGTRGIAILDWEALERVAIEDALEQEERARKSAAHNNSNSGTGGNNNNSNNGMNAGGSGANTNNNTTSSASLKTNPKKKKQVEAKKKKALAGWKSRVLAAVQSGQVDRLQPLLDENRDGNLWTGTGGGAMVGESLLVQLEGLIVACLPKNRFASNINPETRKMLTEFLLEQTPQLFTLPTRSNGRSALHSACFYGNLELMEQIVTANESTARSLDDITCLDSGWTLLQYAAVSGSLRAVEYVLQNCCGAGLTAINTATNDTFTWIVGQHGEGLTVLELIECIFNPDQRNCMETTGMAISEIDKDYLKSGDNAKEYEYLTKMAAIQKRLEQVQSLGAFKPLMEKTINALEESCLQEADRLVAEAQKEKQQQEQPSEKQELPDDENKSTEFTPDAATATAPSANSSTATATTTTTTPATNQSSKKGKKNKSKKNNDKNNSNVVVDEPKSERPASPEVVVVVENKEAEQDPLISALLAMGFEQKQIVAGIEACGGLHRATADDVVTWIVGQTESGAASNAAAAPSPAPAVAPAKKASKSKKKAAETVTASLNKQEGKRIAHPNAPASSSTSTPTVINKSDRSPSSSRNSTPTAEATKRAEEERLATELLAKRKEEQRRRNREWNNKAQVRQRQEAQAKLNQDMKRATAAAAVNKNWPPQLQPQPQQQSNKGGMAQQQRKNAPSPMPSPGDVTAAGSSSTTTNRSLPENVILMKRDASSIASSMDNDDATVSTLGSFQTRGATPVMAALGNLNPYSQQQQQQQQQLYAQHSYSHPYTNPHAQQPPKITQNVVPPGFGQAVQPVAGGDNAYRGYSSSGRAISASSIQPPGIPETQPLVVESSVRSSSIGAPSSAYPASSGSFGNMGDALAGNHNLCSGMMGGPAANSSPGISSSSLAGGVPFVGFGTNATPTVPPGPTGFGSRVASNDSNISPVPPSVASSVSGSLAPHHPQQQQHLPLGSFGLETSSSSTPQKLHESQQHQQHIDASIIESISTGNTVLGSSLWGDPAGTASGSAASSSLLGNLIGSNASRSDAGGVGDVMGSSQPGLFSNKNNANQQQGSNDNISEGLWGRQGSGSFHRSASGGSGSIW